MHPTIPPRSRSSRTPVAASRLLLLGALPLLAACGEEDRTFSTRTPEELVQVMPQLRPGDVLRHGQVALTVPPAGEGLVMEALFEDGHTEQLHVETGLDGKVALGTRPSAPEALASGEHSAQAGACGDGAYNLFPFKWRGTMHWRFNAGSTPAEITVDGAEDKLRAAASNITGGHNDCGLTDAIGASHAYEGRTTRSVAISPSNQCLGAERDSVNVVGFGDLAAGTLGLACTWYSGDGAALESDIRLNKANFAWTLHAESTSCQGRFGVEAVATHEFGHVFGLAHVSEADHAALTMSTAIAPCDASAATLGLGDVRGLRAKY